MKHSGQLNSSAGLADMLLGHNGATIVTKQPTKATNQPKRSKHYLSKWSHINEVHLLVLTLAREQHLLDTHCPFQVITKILLELQAHTHSNQLKGVIHCKWTLTAAWCTPNNAADNCLITLCTYRICVDCAWYCWCPEHSSSNSSSSSRNSRKCC
jgi:hypothetical protein